MCGGVYSRDYGFYIFTIDKNYKLVYNTNMKKIILGLVIGVMLAGSTTAFAITKWQPAKKLEGDGVQALTSWLFDQNSLQVIKFQDNNTLCYVVGVSANGKMLMPSMQCSIK